MTYLTEIRAKMFLLEISGLRFLDIQISDSQMNLFPNFKDIFLYTIKKCRSILQNLNLLRLFTFWDKMNIRAL